MTLPELIDKRFKTLLIITLLLIPIIFFAIPYFTYTFTSDGSQFTSTKLLWGVYEIGAPVIDREKLIEETRIELVEIHESELKLKERIIGDLNKKIAELKNLSASERLKKEAAENKTSSQIIINNSQSQKIENLEKKNEALRNRIEKLLFKNSSNDKVAHIINTTNTHLNKAYLPSHTYTTFLVKNLDWNYDICEINIDVLMTYGGYTKKSCSYKIPSNGFSKVRINREGAEVDINFYEAKHIPSGWCKGDREFKREQELQFVMNSASSAVVLEEMLSSFESALPLVCR